MSKPIVLDIETKYSFREVGNDLTKLGVSCVGIYDYLTDRYSAFMEEELDKLFPILEKASLIIGFNIDRFDFPVLDTIYVGNLSNLPTLDLLEDIKENLGRRLPLDELAHETLGATKSGHGLLAIEYYRDGEFDKLKKYCLDDVKITKDLYEYGKKHGKVFFRGIRERENVKVEWNNRESDSEINLTLGI
jgi:DEAD/DEAH box helicase domain-containing protein